MRIFIAAGDVSGDGHAARLLAALRQRRPDILAEGCGGPALRAAGCDTRWDIGGWSAIGLAQALRLVPRLLRAGRAVARSLAQRPPDLLILVDFGAFNVRLARLVRPLGFPIVYYIPPGCWRHGPAKPEIAALTDLIVTPFPWSETALRAAGADAHFVGHPVLDAPPASRSRAALCAEASLDPGAPILGLLPGSRRQELATHVPLLARAAAVLAERVPSVQFLAAAAPSVGAPALAQAFANAAGPQRPAHAGSGDHAGPGTGIAEAGASGRDEGADGASGQGAGPVVGGTGSGASSQSAGAATGPGPSAALPSPIVCRPTRLGGRPLAVVSGDNRSCLAAMDAVLCCSGTATLEAALLGVPLAVFYRSSPLVTLEGRLRRLAFVGLPNILAGREICREFLASAATPHALAAEAASLLTDAGRAQAMRADLGAVRALLGEPGASGRAAELILARFGARK